MRFKHLRGPAFLIAGMCLALLFSGVANAQLSKDDQKCVNAINKGAAKVAKAQGGDISSCIKNAGKGKLPVGQTIEQCITSDPKGKVAKSESKIQTDKCPNPPAFPDLASTTDKAVIADLMVAKELALVHAIFGTDLDSGVIVDATADKDGSKCQAAVIKAAQKCQDTKLKEFGSCKKNALKVGKDPLPGGAQNAAELQDACLGTGSGSIPDGKGKIAKKCADFDTGKKCAGADLGALFPGAPSVAEIDIAIECEVCKVLNGLDGLARNCDLFDDGVINDTCEGAPPMGEHKCVFDPGASSLTIITQILDLPPFDPSGAVDIICGSEGANGKAPCECVLQFLDPINITGIGYICFTPTDPNEPCDAGEIDCDGGNALDVTMDSDHNIGTCSSNADCEGQCVAHCGSATPFNDACEGFCQGGANADLPCPGGEDSECPGGSCAGKPAHGALCQCDCVTVGGAASAAGTLQCNLGAVINVEVGSPCDGTDTLIAVGTRCIPMTTAVAVSQLHNTNSTPDKDWPDPAFTDTGAGIACDDLATSSTTGMCLVGSVNFFDSTIGDLNTQQLFCCQ